MTGNKNSDKAKEDAVINANPKHIFSKSKYFKFIGIDKESRVILRKRNKDVTCSNMSSM